jgi:hypothetical protein
MEFASFRHQITTEQSAPMNRVLPGRPAPWSGTTLEPVVTVMPAMAQEAGTRGRAAAPIPERAARVVR